MGNVFSHYPHESRVFLYRKRLSCQGGFLYLQIRGLGMRAPRKKTIIESFLEQLNDPLIYVLIVVYVPGG